MPTGFGSGFSPGLGGTGQAQLMLIVGAHPVYQDGDILCSFNRRRIRDVHAHYICDVKHATHNSDGLHDLDTLPEILRLNCCRYKFERISATEVRRTHLDTLDEDVMDETPRIYADKPTPQYVHAALFLERRKAHPRHGIFGTAGNEVWYGGRKNASYDRLTTVWNAIETKTANREENFTAWPATQIELKRFLIISTNDFDDNTGADLRAPLVDMADPENPATVSSRKNWIEWRDLPDVVEADVLNKTLEVDMRGRKQVYQSRVMTRVLP